MVCEMKSLKHLYQWVTLAPYDVLNRLNVGMKVGTHMWLCAVVVAKQDLVVQSLAFAKAVLHT